MRKIIHIDMDCFFAAVEERDHPKLKHKPLAVGGDEGKRGVISTANYIARKFGIHSAMATSQAKKLCPHLVVIKPNINKYREVSNSIREIFGEYTSLIEPLSLDEAFLDVSDCTKCYNSATWMAQEIRKKIYEKEQLTASAGVSVNKFIAKVASDWNKPNGQLVVPPEQVDDFVKQLPVKKIFGVGPKTAEKLNNLGIKTCNDIRECDKHDLISCVGNAFGDKLYNLSRGIDDREVNPNRVRKSLSVEETFANDLQGFAECIEEFEYLLKEFHRRMERHDSKTFRKVFVKIKFSDLSHTTIEQMSSVINIDLIHSLAKKGMLRGNNKSIRLLGIGVRFVVGESSQMELDLN